MTVRMLILFASIACIAAIVLINRFRPDLIKRLGFGEKSTSGSAVGMGAGLGIVLGAGIGTGIDNVGVGVAVGTCVGAAIGSAMGKRKA